GRPRRRLGNLAAHELQRILELRVLVSLLRHVGVRARLLLAVLRRIALEMAAQARLATRLLLARLRLELLGKLLLDDHIRSDALGLDRATRWCVVTRCRQAD